MGTLFLPQRSPFVPSHVLFSVDMASVEQQRTSGSYDAPEEGEQQHTRSRQLTGFGASTQGATERAAAFAPKVEQGVALVHAKKTFKKLHPATTEGVYNGRRKFD